jgi:hypothetical protein
MKIIKISLTAVLAVPLALGQSASSSDDQLHVSFSPYLWFPGMHGTVGSPARQLSVHASAIDILSNFRFGLMGVADLRYKRVVAPIDMFWVRLGDDKTLSNLGPSGTTADVRITQTFITPKIGYRLVDREKLKVDALTGFRYWHLGQKLSFDPSRLGLDFTQSANWVDPLVGARIQMPLSPKVALSLGGDVGGWGTGSELEYQMVAMLGYRIKPKCTLQFGWRYLSVDYRSNTMIFDTVMPGLVFGATFDLK